MNNINSKKKYSKIYFALVIIFVVITGATLYVVQFYTNNMIAELTVNQAQTANQALVNHLKEFELKALERAEIIACSEVVSNAAKNRDYESLKTALESLSFDMDFAAICDETGAVLSENHSESLKDNVPECYEISSVLSGQYGFGKIDYVQNLGLVINAVAAIYDGGKIIGAVSCGYDLSRPELLYEFKDKKGWEASVFYGAERVNTTITDSDGIKATGKYAEEAITEAVIERLENYSGQVHIGGVTLMGYYAPILKEDVEIGTIAIGMLFTGTNVDSTLAKQRNMQFLIVLITMVAMAATGVMFTALSRLNRRFSNTLNELSIKTSSLGILQEVLDAMDIYIYVTDPVTNRILYANKALTTHLNLTGTVTNEYCWSVLKGGVRERCSDCSLGKLLNNPDKVITCESLNEMTGRYYRNTDCLIDWPGGKKVHFCQRIDITEMKHAIERSEHANRAKGDFLSRMSHEMRTPMNAIMGMSNLAKRSDKRSEINGYLDKLDSSASHLLGIINDMLDMSSIETGRLKFTEAQFILDKLIDRAIAVAEHGFKNKQQNFVLKVGHNVPAVLIADESRLAQVVINLLNNASKFTTEGGNISLSVSVVNGTWDSGYGNDINSSGDSVDNTDDTDDNNERECKLLFEVEDDGIGISEEERNRIFSAFEQADNTITRQYGGTGLGLSISSNIVRCMGGEIWMKPRPDKGSIFSFTVRVRVVADADCRDKDFRYKGGNANFDAVELKIQDRDRDRDEYRNENESEGKDKDEIKREQPKECDIENVNVIENIFAGKRVLLADDVEMNRDILIAMIEDTGITVDCAEDGIEACEMFASDPGCYDLILMDIHMPRMNGHESTRTIREMNVPEAKTVSIVAVTADVLNQDAEKCIASGMNDHIGKPLDMEILMTKMKQYLL